MNHGLETHIIRLDFFFALPIHWIRDRMDDWIFYLLTINQIFKLMGSCVGRDG